MALNKISELKKQIILYGKKLGEKNMSPATSGNISVRCADNILISGSGTCLADLSEDEIVLIDSNANLIDGKIKPSSEKNRPGYMGRLTRMPMRKFLVGM